MDDNYQVFNSENVGRTMIKLAIPSIMMAMVDLICNVVNQIFIAQLGSTAMVSSISVPTTLNSLIFAVGEAVGVSSSAFLGRQLGAKNEKSVNEIFRTAITTTLAVAGIMVAVALGLLKPYAFWQTNGNTEVVQYALAYGYIILISSLFSVIRNFLTYSLRAVGDIRFSATVVISSIILNVILDPLFMFDWGLGLNVSGLALATMLAQFLAMAALLWRIISQKTVLRWKLFDFKVNKDILKQIYKVGIAVYIRDALPSLSMTVMVKLAFAYGTAFEAACSIGRYAIYFVNFFINGITASFLPYASYNYGAKKFQRLRHGLKVDMGIVLAYSAVMTTVLILFAGPIFGLFDPGDSDSLIYGTRFLQAYAWSLPVYGFYHMGLTLLQATGRGREATVVSVCRQAVFYIPVIVIAVRLWGQTGIFATQPISDWCSAILTVIVCLPLLRQISQPDGTIE